MMEEGWTMGSYQCVWWDDHPVVLPIFSIRQSYEGGGLQEVEPMARSISCLSSSFLRGVSLFEARRQIVLGLIQSVK